jgi:hypothetical protein
VSHEFKISWRFVNVVEPRVSHKPRVSAAPAPNGRFPGREVVIVILNAAVTRQTIEDLSSAYRDELAAMDIGPLGRIATLI